MVAIVACATFAVIVVKIIIPTDEEVAIAASPNLAGRSLQGIPREGDPDYERKMVAAIKECVQGYLGAKTVGDLLEHVRFPERVERRLPSHYKFHPRKKLRFVSIHDMRALQIGKGSFIYVNMDVTREGADTLPFEHHLLLEQTGSLDFKVDWEGDIHYQPVPWENFIKTRPLKTHEMRVLVERDDFYAFAFRDRKKYQCYKLTSLYSDEHVFGYALHNSRVGRQLASLVPNVVSEEGAEGRESSLLPPDASALEALGAQEPEFSSDAIAFIPVEGQRRPMILGIRFLRHDDSMRGVLIESIVAGSWIYQASGRR